MTTQEDSRKSIKKYATWIIFGAIVLVFALFGLPNRLNDASRGPGGSAGQVNSTLIPFNDLRAEAEKIEQMYAQYFGGKVDLSTQKQMIFGRALEGLIEAEVVYQASNSEGIYSPDKEVADYIVKEIPIFQKDGRFQKEYYENYVRYIGSTAADFETKVRKEKVRKKVLTLFETALSSLPAEGKKIEELEQIKLNFQFAKIDRDSVLEKMSIPQTDIAAFLQKPENLKKVDDDYKSNTNKYKQDEQVKAQHILVKVDSANPESDKKAQEKIQEIQAKLRDSSQKSDFAKLAKMYSDDPGSKDKGGDLGFFGKGQMVPEFEKMAFTLPVGQTSAPFKTDFGYHILKVLEKKEAKQFSLDDVRSQIAKRLLSAEKFDANLKELEEALAQSKEDVVDAKLKSLGINWEETGFVSLAAESLPKIGSGQQVIKKAFELKTDKPLASTLMRDGSFQFVLKLKEKKTEAGSKKVAAVDQNERVYGAFGSWLQEQKQKATINRNLSPEQVQ